MLKIIKRIILIIIVILIIVVGKIYLNYENTHLEVSKYNVDITNLDKFIALLISVIFLYIVAAILLSSRKIL